MDYEKLFDDKKESFDKSKANNHLSIPDIKESKVEKKQSSVEINFE